MRKNFIFKFFTGILLVTTGCNNSNIMRFELAEYNEIFGVPSASGIEVTEFGTYVIGDNSPYLFRLDENYEITEKILLQPKRKLPDSIFEKMQKPDFEALTKTDSGDKLYAFGSGSKSPERELLVEINLQEPTSVKEYNLTEFYRILKKAAQISDEELNIEAAEIQKENLYLFNRGRNLILRYSLDEFMKYLNNSGTIPVPEIFDFTLPSINGIEAGFSGASFAPKGDAIIFTATVEDTSNWIDDGEVLGSFLGIIKLDEMAEIKNPGSVAIGTNGTHLKIKVESVTVLPPFEEGRAELLMVTDSDGGASEILRGTLFF